MLTLGAFALFLGGLLLLGTSRFASEVVPAMAQNISEAVRPRRKPGWRGARSSRFSAQFSRSRKRRNRF